MTGLIPAYLKTVYKKEPVFAHSKTVFTIGQNTFKEKLGSGFIKKALIHASLKEKDLDVYKEGTNTATGMTIGGPVYLGTGGAMTQTAASTSGHLSQEIGVAISATEVEIEFKMPVTLA